MDLDEDEQRDLDARFLLANERTLLAWTRTSLALLAAGGAVEQFATDVRGRTAMAAVLVVLGVLASVIGAVRYRRTEAALRRGENPPVGKEPLALAGALVIVGVALFVAVIVA